jgi:ribosome-associated protein
MSTRQFPYADELEFSYSRSSGSGGQNVNKVNTKATLRWNPRLSRSLSPDVISRFLARYSYRITEAGDLIITSQRYRNQLRNSEDCLEKLEELLKAVRAAPKKRKKTKPKRSAVEKRLSSKKNRSQTKKLRQKGSYSD